MALSPRRAVIRSGKDTVKTSARGQRFVRGKGRFTSDLASRGALHMEVIRSDLPHATVDAVDLSEAASIEGVVGVFEASDLDHVPRIPIRVGPTARLQEHLQPVLAEDLVRYVGEPIAVVLAESAEAARDAALVARIDLKPLRPIAIPDRPSDVDDSLSGPMAEAEGRMGNPGEAFSSADLVIEAEFLTSRRTGLPVETRQLLAEWADDQLHIWGVTKFVDFTRQTLANFFGMPEAAIVVHQVDVGGMFGVRGEVYPEDFLVPWAARRTGRAVRWDEGRREHLVATNQSGEQLHHARLALDDEGRFLAFEDRVVLDMGAYARPIGSRLAHIIVETLPGPYRWTALDLRCRGIATTKPPVGTIRGPAAYETAFVRERMIDIAAGRLAIDPLELRRVNLVRPDAMPFEIPFAGAPHPVTYDSGDYPRTLGAFVEAVGWDSLKQDRDERRARGEAVGLGWSISVIHSGLGKEESVALSLDTSGVFSLRTSAADVGQGLDAALAKIVQAHLGVGSDEVIVESGESVAGLIGNGTFSSRSTIFVGGAALNAVDRLRSLATEKASQLFGTPTEEVRLGLFGAESRTETITWKELAPLTVTGEFRMEEPTYGLAVHLAQVALDLDTGDVRPERLWVGYDCGRAVDRVGVANQLVGGAIAGVSGALHERVYFDDGVPVSVTLGDYGAAVASAIPDVRCFVFELEPSPGNPLGAKGAGEAGTIGAGAAVANAVADAAGEAGEAIYSLPLLPAEVFRLLDAHRREGISR
ncbi:MAG TPA: xanthine dehydrogenase family protein molybdopterin-binding subunit [Acidimicrobiia bacterium]|nr:xanthine dehydrogenase family protein molybdopterin-binding subunit [Acidimicrobiia bacterium]